MINEHLEDAMNAALDQEDENQITAYIVELHIDANFHPKIRNMLRKHEKIWNILLGKITATSHLINPIPGSHPLRSSPSSVVRKTHRASINSVRWNITSTTVLKAQRDAMLSV